MQKNTKKIVKNNKKHDFSCFLLFLKQISKLFNFKLFRFFTL